ncbi:MAG: bifunctional precorrin-2 dehydrogenase/sirohydrochlorin ferrochelatase [bacterium]
MSDYYPICLDLKDKKCVVVGGGEIALRKVKSLVEAQAKVVVISPEIISSFKELLKKNKITYLKQEYKSKHIKNDTFLVIVATDDKQLNAKIANDAGKLNLLINVVDAPSLGNFILPATFHRGKLIISVSTSGQSPALAKKIKEDLLNIYGVEYEILVDLLGNLRTKVHAKYKNKEDRKVFWEKLVNSDLIEYIRNNKEEEIKRYLSKWIFIN